MYAIMIVFLGLVLAGCASEPVYNPMQASLQQEIELNQDGLKKIVNGMSLDQVHQILGQELVVGYKYQAADYKPLTIPNPYRTQVIKEKGFLIEYYIQAIRQPDGIVHDNQLMPLVFKNDKLMGRGWLLVNSIHPV